MSRSIERLLRPRSIAFVGASESAVKVGGRRFLSLIASGFEGALYPVSPRPTVAGLAAYPDIATLPTVPDLVVVAIASAGVDAVVAACAGRGVGGVVVITGGFGEQSAEGLRLETGFAETLNAAGARLVGPNCAGLFSAEGRVNVTGMDLVSGPIGLITQSGNVLLDAAHRARRSGIGFSSAVSIGNGVDLRAPELLDFMLDDPATEAVLVYLEGWRPGEARAFCDTVRRRPPNKPVIVLKPGDTEAGQRAVASHTGALAGEARVAAGAFQQAGILQARSLDEAWALAEALTHAPPLRKAAIAVAADGGGHATLGCDALGRAGLRVPVFGPALQAGLAALLPARCPVTNPLDYAGFVEEQPAVAVSTIERCLADPEIGGVLLAGHFGGYHRLAGNTVAAAECAAASRLGELAAAAGKPVVVHSVYADDPEPAVRTLRAGGVPVLRRLDDAATVLAGLHRWAELRSRPVHAAETAVEPRLVLPSGPMLEPDARALLAARGIAMPPAQTVGTAADCTAAAVCFGGMVALKIVSAMVLHKSDVGGVLLNVTPDQAAAGFARLLAVGREAGDPAASVLVTPMAAPGTELVVGGFRDVAFGPVVMLGLGGVLVEVLGEVVFRLAPLELVEALAMPASLRQPGLLAGHRGQSPVDNPALARLLIAVAQLMADEPGILEVDLNPVIATCNGLVCVDARVVVG